MFTFLLASCSDMTTYKPEYLATNIVANFVLRLSRAVVKSVLCDRILVTTNQTVPASWLKKITGTNSFYQRMTHDSLDHYFSAFPTCLQETLMWRCTNSGESRPTVCCVSKKYLAKVPSEIWMPVWSFQHFFKLLHLCRSVPLYFGTRSKTTILHIVNCVETLSSSRPFSFNQHFGGNVLNT